ncbi:MAG: hypothetical protein HQK78_15635, partial [Desulfobacterales bacterium]|nr:hypothetical protein [Desulfobacterales bacterium]
SAIINSALEKAELIEPHIIKKCFCFHSDFIGFSGHFPNYPILPAIVQIIAAIITIEEYKGFSLKLIGLDKAKFNIPILPEEIIKIECKEKMINKKLGADVELSTGKGRASSFSMFYTNLFN